MENNNENKVSTQDYYSNVETPKIEETPKIDNVEQTYTLEDLHPEIKETNTPVAPVASPTEEIQPDPTIINGEKATFGEISSSRDLPKIQTMALGSTIEPHKKPTIPVAATTPKVKVPIKKIEVKQPTDSNETPNAKIYYLVFGVILLLVIVGLPLYSSIENSLTPSIGISEPVTEDNEEQQNNDEPKINTEDQPDNSIQQEDDIPIVFDMTLNFDKGLVSNVKEINQKAGYLPHDMTGVIRCDLERPIVMEGITTYASTYLYYEKYKLKSAITVTKQVYMDEITYSETKNSTYVYKTAGDKYESLDVEIIQEDEKYTVINKMKYNLEYGNSTFIDDLNTHILFSSNFGTDIKKAIDNAITTGINNGNTICGTVNTKEASI